MLLFRAMQEKGAGQAWYWEFFTDENGEEIIKSSGLRISDWGKRQAKKWIAEYLKARLIDGRFETRTREGFGFAVRRG
jgi:hypothetical protein